VEDNKLKIRKWHIQQMLKKSAPGVDADAAASAGG